MKERLRIAEETGHYFVDYDADSGLIYVNLSGFWTREVGHRFYSALASLCGQSRAQNGSALILFDALNLPIQAELMAKDAGEQAPFVAPGDKIAFVTVSQLLKIQMRRLDPSSGGAAYFENVQDAQDWLLALRA